MEYKLYVGNLSYTTTEPDLQTLFAQAGAVFGAGGHASAHGGKRICRILHHDKQNQADKKQQGNGLQQTSDNVSCHRVLLKDDAPCAPRKGIVYLKNAA